MSSRADYSKGLKTSLEKLDRNDRRNLFFSAQFL